MLDLSEFWAPHRERMVLDNADRRDMLEMTTGLATYLDRVFAAYFEGEAPNLTRPEFVADSLTIFEGDQGETGAPIEQFVFDLFGGSGELLTELDADDVFAVLSALEASAVRLGAQRVAVIARAAQARLAESELGVIGWKPDVALVLLLELRELARLLDERLLAVSLRCSWLEQLSESVEEILSGEEDEERAEPRSVLDHGPPSPVFLSVVQPHAPPPVRCFSAPLGETSTRLKAGEGLMAA